MPLKNARIHLRVTDEEKQSLVEKATLARQSVSQYILLMNGKGLNPGHFLRTTGTQIITGV